MGTLLIVATSLENLVVGALIWSCLIASKETKLRLSCLELASGVRHLSVFSFCWYFGESQEQRGKSGIEEKEA
jgi:hypothetical protein